MDISKILAPQKYAVFCDTGNNYQLKAVFSTPNQAKKNIDAELTMQKKAANGIGKTYQEIASEDGKEKSLFIYSATRTHEFSAHFKYCIAKIQIQKL